MTAARFRVFVSSPSDVFAERERLERVITSLNGEFGGGMFEVIRWERTYYTAAKTFQDQIPLPSQTDLVICIFWKRLGFELPVEYRRADGTTPTGSEFEFEDAMGAARDHGTPDVLVYRKSAPVLLDAENVEAEQAQFEGLKRFWTRWFRNATGHFTAAYHSFDTTDGFETAVMAHLRQWLARHDLAASGPSWPVELRGSPFRGLLPFDSAHAEVFFGRRRAVERARERLGDAAHRGTPFLLILGTSGCGKSSLVRAGLIPRLRQPGAVPDVDVWRSCVVLPSEGAGMAEALARALYAPDCVPELAAGDNPTPADFAALLATAPQAAARAVKLALARAGEPVAAREGFGRPVVARLLLLIDQLEEALTPPEQRDAFARALEALVSSGVVWVVATLRSDLYALFQTSAPLMALRDGGAQLDLAAPSAAELAEIVTGPALAAGLRFDRRADGAGLDEILIESAAQPGTLPLLQLTLDELFEARDRAANLLTFAAYDALGGLSGVVERRAEAALLKADPAAQAALPAVLRALVNVTDGGVVTGRAASATLVAATDAARRLVDLLIGARLLVADSQGGGAGLRIAHDALLLAWPRAVALIAADRDALRTRARVEAAMRRWRDEGCHADFLLPHGRPLVEAVELAAHPESGLDQDCLEFVAASQAAEQSRVAAAQAVAERALRLEAQAQQARAEAADRVLRRTRVAALVVSALLLVAAGAAVLATVERKEAARESAQAERNFESALDAGVGLIDAASQHLRDGGMSRGVAGAMLRTAEATLGALASGPNAAAKPRLGDAQVRLSTSFSAVQLALCDSVGARARAADAVTVAAALASQAPSADRQVALLRALDARGEAEAGDGDAGAALASFRHAEAVASAMAAPGDDAAGEAVRAMRRDHGTVLLVQGELDPALAMFRDDLAWQQGRMAAYPDDAAALGVAATDHRRIGTILLNRKLLPDAQDAFERAATLLRRLVAGQPDNLEWQRALSITTQQIAGVLAALGHAEAALAQARAAVDLAAGVANRDPGNAEWQRDLVTAQIRLGAQLAKSGDAAGAARVLRPMLTAIKALTGPAATSAQCKGDAARLQKIVGLTLLLTNDPEASAAALEASLALAAELARAAPEDRERQHDLADAHLSIAQAATLAHRPADAINHDRAAIDILKPLLANAAQAPDRQRELADARLNLGDALLDTGDAAGALASYQEAHAAAETLAAAQPDVAQWQDATVVSLLRISRAEQVAHKSEEQWAALQSALAAAQRLAAAGPATARWRYDLLDAREEVATAQSARGDLAGALANYRVALMLAEQLVAAEPGNLQWRNARAGALRLLGTAYQLNGQPDEAQPYLAAAQQASDGLAVQPAGNPAKP